MLDIINNAFPQADTNTFLQTLTDAVFHIYDHDIERRCYIQTDLNSIKHFTVENPAKKPIHFLAIDKCLLSDTDQTQRCDCAVFDDETFCFVEIKTTSSMTQRKKLRREAKDQLKATVTYFKDHIVFTTEQIEAYVCLLTELTTRPLNRASLVEETEEFEELGVTLFHDNIKRF